ncbi:MAG: hypothetical protein WAN87_05925 [Thermoplasmata archaeon]
MSADDEPHISKSSGPASGTPQPPAEDPTAGSPANEASSQAPAAPGGGALSSKRSRPYLLPVIAVLAVVVVVLGLMLGGVIPGFFGNSKSSSPTPATLSYSQAAGVAKATADGSGGPWLVFSGAAVELPSPFVVPGAVFTDLSANLSAYGCVVTWEGNVITSGLSIPGTPSTAATGEANFWLFLLTTSSGSIQVVTVSNGTGSGLVLVGGLVCELIGEELQPLNESILSSSQSVSIANTAGGSAFLATHPQAIRAWGVAGIAPHLNLSESVWAVVYTTCPASGTEPTSPQPAFNATINAMTGHVLTSGTTNVTCGSLSLSPLSLSQAMASGVDVPSSSVPLAGVTATAWIEEPAYSLTPMSHATGRS